MYSKGENRLPDYVPPLSPLSPLSPGHVVGGQRTLCPLTVSHNGVDEYVCADNSKVVLGSSIACAQQHHTVTPSRQVQEDGARREREGAKQ